MSKLEKIYTDPIKAKKELIKSEFLNIAFEKEMQILKKYSKQNTCVIENTQSALISLLDEGKLTNNLA